jgi:hypothetical protein
MDEADAWSHLRPHLVAFDMDPVRVENILMAGTPDVNYKHGWIENKYLDAFPVRPETPVRVKFRPDQVPWLTRRWYKGGLAWLFVRVGKELFLFSGFDAMAVKQGLTQRAFRDMAVWSAQIGKISRSDTLSLKRWLTGIEDHFPAPDRARFHRLRCLKTVEQTAAALGWAPWSVIFCERTYGVATDDLLAYWEN